MAYRSRNCARTMLQATGHRRRPCSIAAVLLQDAQECGLPIYCVSHVKTVTNCLEQLQSKRDICSIVKWKYWDSNSITNSPKKNGNTLAELFSWNLYCQTLKRAYAKVGDFRNTFSAHAYIQTVCIKLDKKQVPQKVNLINTTQIFRFTTKNLL